MNVSGQNYILARLTGNQVLVAKNNPSENLSDEEKLALEKLKKRDREVRMHEAQHMGNSELNTIGGPHYTYTIGPDGKPYVTGGKVTISTGAVSDADDAMRKARAMQNASMSVGEPSSQDMAAAGAARAMEMEALAEKSGEKNLSSSGKNNVESYNSRKSSFDMYA